MRFPVVLPSYMLVFNSDETGVCVCVLRSPGHGLAGVQAAQEEEARLRPRRHRFQGVQDVQVTQLPVQYVTLRYMTTRLHILSCLLPPFHLSVPFSSSSSSSSFFFFFFLNIVVMPFFLFINNLLFQKTKVYLAVTS